MNTDLWSNVLSLRLVAFEKVLFEHQFSCTFIFTKSYTGPYYYNSHYNEGVEINEECLFYYIGNEKFNVITPEQLSKYIKKRRSVKDLINWS